MKTQRSKHNSAFFARRSFAYLAASVTKLVTLFLEVGTSNVYNFRIRVYGKKTSP